MTNVIDMGIRGTLWDHMMPNVQGQTEICQQLMTFTEIFDTPHNADLWLKLVVEEVTEFQEEFLLEGITSNLLKEFSDVLYVMQGLLLLEDYEGMVAFDKTEQEKLDAVLQECAAVADIAYGLWTTEQVLEGFKRVHDSNMSKLDNDGNVLRREDGKVMKGPNYSPPDMEGIFSCQTLVSALTTRML